MKSLFSIGLMLVLYGTTESLTREYLFGQEPMNWTSAQRYCRQRFGDLATITTDQEYLRVLGVMGRLAVFVWIGLKRTAPNENTWQWSNGEDASFRKWQLDQPSNVLTSPGENCVAMSLLGWNDDVCTQKFHPVCSRRIILVQMTKTWAEALKHCTAHYAYFLSVDSQRLFDLIQTETAQTQTVSVWTGLRFLSGTWFWVNWGPAGSQLSLPQCPSRPYRCGAYNSITHIWENRDCNEKLNFVCYY